MTYYSQTSTAKHLINLDSEEECKPDFNMVTTLAYEELISHGCNSFPINVDKFTDNGHEIICTSFQEYAELTNTPIEKLTLNGEYGEGLATRELRPNLRLIMYNEQTFDQRQRYTLYHEIDHLKCNHKKHGDQEEVEAHFFAAQVLMPNVVLKELKRRGKYIDQCFLTETFGVSKEAAGNKIEYLRKYPSINTHRNQFDDIVLSMFSHCIDDICPVPFYFIDDDYEDYMKGQRNTWGAL